LKIRLIGFVLSAFSLCNKEKSPHPNPLPKGEGTPFPFGGRAGVEGKTGVIYEFLE